MPAVKPTPGSGAPPPPPAETADKAPPDPTNGFRTLLAWGLIIVLVLALDRSRFGHVLVYYSLASVIFLTLLVSAPSVAYVLAPLQPKATSNVTG